MAFTPDQPQGATAGDLHEATRAPRAGSAPTSWRFSTISEREYWRRTFAGRVLQGWCANPAIVDSKIVFDDVKGVAEALCDALEIGTPPAAPDPASPSAEDIHERLRGMIELRAQRVSRQTCIEHDVLRTLDAWIDNRTPR